MGGVHGGGVVGVAKGDDQPLDLGGLQELLRAIWGDSAYRDPRTIDVHIRHLREKIEPDPREPAYIFTVRGVGYRFRDASQ